MFIIANTISEFQYHAIVNLFAGDEGYKQKIDRGSFAGDAYRLQYPFLTGEIQTPLHDLVPVPPGNFWPESDTLEVCQQYFQDYIVGGAVIHGNEDYTYAERIARQDQLTAIMEMLRKTPNTNQAAIAVGAPEDPIIHDPACLREIHFKFFDGCLNIYTFWRSHDLLMGLPRNLVGMAMLLEVVAEYAGLKPGKMFYSSSGSHIYSYQLDSLK